jgi:flagellin
MATAMYSGARIRTNLPAQQAYNSLVIAGQKISESQLRLSTGKRINSAADDVAGFITSKSLLARNGSLRAAKQAAGDAKNVTSIAMDSLEQIADLVTTIKEMAAQASAGALGTDEKVTLANSAFRLAEQIQFITDSTVFGGQQLLQGGFSGQ